jgi:PAS domain S-box-containing protein
MNRDPTTRRILIIDDEPLIRLSVADFLEESNYETFTAEDGLAGLEAARTHALDVVLIDLRLPRMDGLEVIDHLSQEQPDLPLVVFSGTAALGDALEAMRMGAWDYITKPVSDIEEILFVLDRVLDHAQLKAEVVRRERERAALEAERRAIEKSEQHWRALTEHAMDVVTVFDLDGTIKYESPSVLRILGYEPEELVGKSGLDYVHPEDRAEARRALGTLAHTPQRLTTVELRFKHKNGSWRILEGIGQNLAHDPAVQGIVFNSRDVTAQREMEVALRESEARYRALFENANDAILLMDGPRFIDCNRMAAKIFDLSRNEIIKRTPWDLSPSRQQNASESKELAEARIAAALKGDAQRFEWHHLRSDGSIIEAEVSLNRLLLSGKTYLQAIVRDQTDRRRAEEAVAETQALLLAAIEQTPAGILIADAPDVTIRVANSAALNIRGKTPVPLTKISVEDHQEAWQIYHLDGARYRPEELPLSRAILQGKRCTNVEALIKREDGTARHVLANAAPVRNAKGEIIAGVVVFADITDLRGRQDKGLEIP